MSTTLTTPSTMAADRGTGDNKRWWILAVLGIAQLMVVLDATIVNIALPTAQTDLHFSDASRQWIVTAYALAFGSLLLIGGRIVDIVGQRRTLLIGAVGFAVASAIGGAAVNFGMLAAARAIQGAFGALLAPAVLAVLTTAFTDTRERAKAFGIFGAIAGAGASVGLLLGGILTEYANWRWTLYVNLFFAVITLVGSWLLLGKSARAERSHLDGPGALLVTLGLFAVVFGFSHAAPPSMEDSARWGDVQTIGSLAIGAILLIAFVFAERRVRGPLLPLSIVLDRNRGGALVAMFLASVGMFGVFLFLTYYLESPNMAGFSPVKTGLAFLPMTALVVLVASVGSAMLVPKVSARVLIPLGLLLCAFGMWLLTNLSLDSGYLVDILPGTLVMGAGMGLVFAPAISLATIGVDAEHAGVASAAVNAMQQVGGAIGTALLNTISVTAATGYVSAHAAEKLVARNAELHSYLVPFWIAAAIFAAGAVISALVLRSGVPKSEAEALSGVVG